MFDDIPKALQESIFLDFFETARVAKLNANDYGNYQESLKNYRDWYAIHRTHEREIEDAEHKGREEGIEQGIEKGKLEVAYNLLDLLDDETIALKTGLSVTQIQKMRQSAPMP
jgi:predicted transposase/invertase (TIGR01784 family)